MGGSFMGFSTAGPDEVTESDSPRDYDRRNGPNEAIADRLTAELQNPSTTPHRRAVIEKEIQERAHVVLPGSRKTGRRVYIEGEGFIEERTDDSDVVKPTGMREALKP